MLEMRWLGASYKNVLKNKPCQKWVIYDHSECRQGNLRREENWCCFLLAFLPPYRSDVLSSWACARGSFPTRGSPLSSYAPSLPSVQNLGVCRPDLWLCCRSRQGVGKDLWACGVLSTVLISALPVARVWRKKELSLPGRHWLSYIPLWNLHCSATSRPRCLNVFYPLHRVVLLSITCSVRNGRSDLLSTYCVPCTKFFKWMISLDFQNWYE